MKQFFITLIAAALGVVIGLIILFGLFFAMSIGSAKAAMDSGNEGVNLSEAGVLTLDFRYGVTDFASQESLFGNEAQSVVGIVRALHTAKSDEHVKGLFIRANSWGMSPATAEEIRSAIADFKSAGKFVIAHAQGFEGTSPGSYMAIAGADEIWLQDTTSFAIAGYRAETEFYGGVFEKLDAKPEFIQFHEYKNAANVYTQKGFTEAHREAVTSYMGSISDTVLDAIAADRSISRASVDQFLAAAPHSAEDAKEAGYIDTLGHVHEAKDYAKDKAGKDAKFVSLRRYNQGFSRGDVIAFIGGQGVVREGSSNSSGVFGGEEGMGGDTVSKALLKAAKNKKVKAIVLRVNSPGGSATASDQIWDAVKKAQDAEKPVIVSMGQLAASGGYYVAAPADKIIANNTTITGSIGVLGGKVALNKTMDKIGYNVEAINFGGEFTAAYSAFEPWSDANRERMRAQMAAIYDDFTGKVAKGRDIELDKVRELAKGRVYSGAQAKELGLVDEIGGFMTALNAAKSAAGLDQDAAVKIQVFPRPKTQFEQLEALFNVSAANASDLQALRALAATPEFQAVLKAKAATRPNAGAQLRAFLPNIE